MQGRRAAPLEYTGRVRRMRYEERSELERCIHRTGSGGGQKHLGSPLGGKSDESARVADNEKIEEARKRAVWLPHPDDPPKDT
jgi:hypothetical protein